MSSDKCNEKRTNASGQKNLLEGADKMENEEGKKKGVSTGEEKAEQNEEVNDRAIPPLPDDNALLGELEEIEWRVRRLEWCTIAALLLIAATCLRKLSSRGALNLALLVANLAESAGSPAILHSFRAEIYLCAALRSVLCMPKCLRRVVAAYFFRRAKSLPLAVFVPLLKDAELSLLRFDSAAKAFGSA
ncbi:hypothetical protein niasHS_013242 [Heterodera schachtii]|uniref:Uncharacterized protein n=1 Tax=Heterodera schachtii TaxID=97005 RepID=A0ABD2IV98_HETSC